VPLLRAALRRDPTQQDAIFTLGLAYLYSGRAGDALNYLRIAHDRQPWTPALNFFLGETYRLIGDTRAEEYLQRARRWSPTELWRRLAEAGLELLDSDVGAASRPR
jgi:predicted Zn-dependent protease